MTITIEIQHYRHKVFLQYESLTFVFNNTKVEESEWWLFLGFFRLESDNLRKKIENNDLNHKIIIFDKDFYSIPFFFIKFFLSQRLQQFLCSLRSESDDHGSLEYHTSLRTGRSNGWTYFLYDNEHMKFSKSKAFSWRGSSVMTTITISKYFYRPGMVRISFTNFTSISLF